MYNVHDFTSISKHIDNYVNNIWGIQFNVACLQIKCSVQMCCTCTCTALHLKVKYGLKFKSPFSFPVNCNPVTLFSPSHPPTHTLYPLGGLENMKIWKFDHQFQKRSWGVNKLLNRGENKNWYQFISELDSSGSFCDKEESFHQFQILVISYRDSPISSYQVLDILDPFLPPTLLFN